MNHLKNNRIKNKKKYKNSTFQTQKMLKVARLMSSFHHKHIILSHLNKLLITIQLNIIKFNQILTLAPLLKEKRILFQSIRSFCLKKMQELLTYNNN